ncbi:DUF523 domain-containing protein [Limisalsivibrio acetivorans]|uniref:DUF523 domain-containing protein n=1 Tax=Limisalsivibrio acetivorans TaxID=1304888 RepID=UPI0003B67F00|nr:DUF523 domain-containing protein [Limisalsivibrio acetivorans]
MRKILVSSCLLGENVRYNGGNNLLGSAVIDRWIEEERVMPFCPEVEGGLPTPRKPAEICGGGGGGAVLSGVAIVRSADGEDFTENFIKGARLALERCREHGIETALLKQGSPSCGCRLIYDGSFSGIKCSGMGVAASLLSSAGIRVFGEDELPDGDVTFPIESTKP